MLRWLRKLIPARWPDGEPLYIGGRRIGTILPNGAIEMEGQVELLGEREPIKPDPENNDANRVERGSMWPETTLAPRDLERKFNALVDGMRDPLANPDQQKAKADE